MRNMRNASMSTIRTHSTSGKYPQVYRCWRKDGVIAGEEVLWTYGEYCCSIKQADKYIAEKLKES